MIYELSKMSDLVMYESMITNTDSSLYYHRSKWFDSVVVYLLSITNNKWEKGIRWFVTNTAKSLTNNAGGFYVSFTQRYYSNNDQNIGYRVVTSLLYHLEECQFIDIYKGYVKEYDIHGKPTWVVKSFVQFKEKYLALWDTIDVHLHPNTEVEEMIEIRNRETGENKSLKGRNGISTLREGVQMLNQSLKDVSIEFQGKRLATVEYKRVYSNTLQEAGRFFVSGGGVQLLPEKYRSSCLTFNGEPVVELDYSSIHPMLCLERLNMAGGFDCNVWDIIGRDFKPYGADLSDIVTVDYEAIEDHKEKFGLDKYDPVRNLAKLTLLISINAIDREGAVSAVSNKLYQDSKKKEADKLFVGIVKPTKVLDVCEAIRKHNYLIEDYFYSDAGMRLMNTDSNIASRVVSAMIQEGESVLIYHDSFICRASAEDKLLGIMKNAWKEEVGDNQFCFVSKK
jgi:hypothetical protein